MLPNCSSLRCFQGDHLRRSQLLVPLACGLLALMIGILLRAADPGGLVILRERTFDLYQRVDPPRIGRDTPVRIVDVDDASLAILGQWPWPRDIIADLVLRLGQAGAAVVALDMIFPEPDRSNAASLVETWDLPAGLRSALGNALANEPSHDESLARALRAVPSVLGVALATSLDASPASFTPAAGMAIVGPDPQAYLATSPATVGNLPMLQEAASGLGSIHVSGRDDDAVIRHIPALTLVGEAYLPSLFIEALRVAQGAQSLILRTNEDPAQPLSGVPESLRIGDVTLSLTQTGDYRLRYGVLDPGLTIPAHLVLAGDAPLSSIFSGTIVLVGTSAPGLFDLRATALGTIAPGVSIHAQAIAAILAQRNLVRADWTGGLELALILAAGLSVIAAGLLARPLIAAVSAALVIGALAGGSWWAFTSHLMLVDASAPILVTLLTFGATNVPVLIGTDQQQRFIRSAFSRYLAEPVLARLERDPRALRLEGERIIITVLFMDMRGFTTRAETMEPGDAVHLLNSMLDPLSQAVLEEEGTIDKFMGDGMMAFWNAPLDQGDHAARAVRAALGMQAVMERFAGQTSADGKPLTIGIGIHSGEAFVGNMGSTRRFAYSAIGDTVNLAARIETLTASLQVPLLVSQATLSTLPQQLAELFEDAGEHAVKGRAQQVRVYALKA